MSLSWKSLLARTAAVGGLASVMLSVGVFVGMRLAKADPGGPTGNELTFSGVLREPGGALASRAVSLTFVFRRVGLATPCSTTATATAINGAFTANVPIGGCGRAFFDGEGVTYDVLEGSSALATGVSITPVPYARFADQVGIHNECPVGYARMTDAATPSGRWFCRRGVDDVVRVGDGAEAFWIDRYEASVNASAAGEGTWLFTADDTSGDLPRNGQWGRTATVAPAYAVSVAGRRPASWVTWFQAMEACRASGKRLPTSEEWLTAANGTDDPTTPNDGNANSRCNTQSSGPRNTGGGGGCRSVWGVQDMIGNVWEWTAEWYAGAGTTTFVNDPVQNWSADYNADGTWNVNGHVNRGSGGGVVGLPAAARRGGPWDTGIRAGVFALDIVDGPSNWSPGVGFRCALRR